MCKKFLTGLLGGDAPEAQAQVQGASYATEAQVRDRPKEATEAPARSGGVVEQERRRGRLAGLGL